MDYEHLAARIDDRILTLTLNRPERLNAFTGRMCEELIDALDRADADDSVRAIIVTGAGRAFCAGADLGRGAGTFDHTASSGPEAIDEHRDAGGLLTLRIYDCKKPVLAAINGPAVGIGITMTLPMDVRIASSAAKMGFVFARRGIVPEAASSWFLPRVVGMSQSAEWVLTGRVFDAEEALRGGLVSRVVAPDELLPTVRALALEIANNTSAMSVALARQMLWKMAGADHPMEAHKIDSKAIAWLGRNADAREGVTAFLEKREPKFTLKPSEMPGFYPFWRERKFRP